MSDKEIEDIMNKADLINAAPVSLCLVNVLTMTEHHCPAAKVGDKVCIFEGMLDTVEESLRKARVELSKIRDRLLPKPGFSWVKFKSPGAGWEVVCTYGNCKLVSYSGNKMEYDTMTEIDKWVEGPIHIPEPDGRNACG